DPSVFAHRPLYGVVWTLAAGDASKHVGKQERRDNLLDRGREWTGIPVEADDVGEVLQHLHLGIGADDGHGLLVAVFEEWHVVAAAGDHAILPVVGQVLQELLRRLRVLRELPDKVYVGVGHADPLAPRSLGLARAIGVL